MNILQGKRILETINSEINGELTVVQDLFFGTYIMGGGLPQSGGLALDIWKTTLNEVNKDKLKIKNCLILGLGGGGIAKLVNEHWPNAKITGVDVDEVIVDLGKKYLNLEEYNVDISIEDASKFIKKALHSNEVWDLICVDTYIGDEFPKKFESELFVKKVKKLLSKNKNSLAIFNRLYGPEDVAAAKKFGKTLSLVFSNVEKVFPEANLMFVCKA